MENWANRKTLILGRTDMIGLLTPSEYNDCVEQAYRMHGEGHCHVKQVQADIGAVAVGRRGNRAAPRR